MDEIQKKEPRGIEKIRSMAISDNSMKKLIENYFQGEFSNKNDIARVKLLVNDVCIALEKTEKIDIESKEAIERAFKIIRTSVRLDLELNPDRKFAYIVPRGGLPTLEISYLGFLNIIYKSGEIQDIYADVVYEDETDNFSFKSGGIRELVHFPKILFESQRTKGEHNKIVGAYSIIIKKDGTKCPVLMSISELNQARKASKSNTESPDSVWSKWKPEMYKKVVIKRGVKTELATITNDKRLIMANEIDNAQYEGEVRYVNEEGDVEAEIIEENNNKTNDLLDKCINENE